QYQKAEQHPRASGSEGGRGQVVESFREFDRGQPEGEQAQVAEDIAKGLGESGDPFEPIHESAKHIGQGQTEWALAGKEQYQQTAERKTPQSDTWQRTELWKLRIVFPQPDAEAAKNDGGPPQCTQRNQRMPAPPDG